MSEVSMSRPIDEFHLDEIFAFFQTSNIILQDLVFEGECRNFFVIIHKGYHDSDGHDCLFFWIAVHRINIQITFGSSFIIFHNIMKNMASGNIEIFFQLFRHPFRLRDSRNNWLGLYMLDKWDNGIFNLRGRSYDLH